MRDEDTTENQPAEAPATPEPAAASTDDVMLGDPVAEPAHQTVEGHYIPVIDLEGAAKLEFIRDFVQGVPYAVDAVNAAKAG